MKKKKILSHNDNEIKMHGFSIYSPLQLSQNKNGSSEKQLKSINKKNTFASYKTVNCGN